MASIPAASAKASLERVISISLFPVLFYGTEWCLNPAIKSSGSDNSLSTIDSSLVAGIKDSSRCTKWPGTGGRNEPMKNPGKILRISRRDVLMGSVATLTGAALSTRVMADVPPAEPVTPDLIAAARKEGQVIYYTSTDLPVAEGLAKAFEAKYPGIAVRVERTGAERVFQRIGQEYSSNIHAVDVVNSSDAAHFITWKRDGILAPYVPEDVAKFYPPEHRDADGQFASWRIWLSIIAYNTNLVKAEEAPKSFADLLDPKYTRKIVKAHTDYSGTIMTATYQMQRDLGWSWFEQLAKQNIMQVQ